MRPLSLLLVGLMGAALGFAPAPVFREKPNDPEAVLRRLQGRWRIVSYTQDGRSLSSDTVFWVQVEKNTWRLVYGSPPKRTIPLTIALDTKSKPMRIDWRERGTHFKGIFVLSDDKLHYSHREANKGYPQSLAAPASEDYVIEAEREK